MSNSVKQSSFRDKWSEPIERHGYVCVPNLLLESAYDLGLTASQLLVLVVLMKHWWSKESEVFPSYALIAKQAGISARTAARTIKQLAESSYIHIEHSGGLTNRYSLKPLVGLLDDIARSMGESSKTGRGNPRHFVTGAPDSLTSYKDSRIRPP